MNSTLERKLAALTRSGKALREVTVEERAAGLAAASARWFSGNLTARGKSVTELSRVTGFSEAVVAAGLDRLFGAVTAPEILKWWTRRDRPVSAPRSVLIVSAGNIPGVSLFPAMGCLLAGVPVMIKSATAEPVSAPLWHDLLRNAAPRLAESVLCATWRGGDGAVEDVLFDGVDRILVYGRDETVEDLSARCAGKVSGYGTGVSFAVIGDASEHDASAARMLALDMAVWDQHGCLSPRLAFVAGGFERTVNFGGHLADALAEIQVELPRGRLSVHEAAAIRTFRADAEARMVSGDRARLRTPDPRRFSMDWTVTVDDGPEVLLPPANRTILLKPLASLEDLTPLLAAWRGRWQSAGLGPGVDAGAATSVFRGAHVTHVVPLGTMQAPAIGWLNKGRDLLEDLVPPEGERKSE